MQIKLRPRPSRGALALLLPLLLSCIAGAGEETRPVPEPRPPDMLDLELAAPAPRGRDVLIDAIIRPLVDGDIEIEIDGPARLERAPGSRSLRMRLERGEPVRRERLRVRAADRATGRATSVRVRLGAFDTTGRPWLSIERELDVGEDGAVLARPRDAGRGAADERVPIIRTGRSGARIVEYMTRAEAAARGLSPAPAPRAAPAAGVEEQGGDPRRERRAE